jgi:CRISPR system Cascade subunit CasA
LIPGNLHLQILGLTVDNAKPLGWTSEQFSAPVAYLTERSLWDALKHVITIAEDHQQIFRSFRGSPYHSLAEALKNYDAGSIAKSLDGESRYWATLDREFQILLEALPNDKTIDGNGTIYGSTKLPEWTKVVQNAAREAFTESIASIRNYQARAIALRSLDFQLRKLRGEEPEKSSKAKTSSKAI